MTQPNLGLWWSPRLIVADATLPTQTRTAGIVFIDAASGTAAMPFGGAISAAGGRRAAGDLAMNALRPPPTFAVIETE